MQDIEKDLYRKSFYNTADEIPSYTNLSLNNTSKSLPEISLPPPSLKYNKGISNNKSLSLINRNVKPKNPKSK